MKLTEKILEKQYEFTRDYYPLKPEWVIMDTETLSKLQTELDDNKQPVFHCRHETVSGFDMVAGLKISVVNTDKEVLEVR